MKVFVSWSGELSKEVAQLFGSWIEDVLQEVKAWVSTDDINKGAIWFDDITSELRDTAVGVLCVTRENMNAPWLLFEAGALSKGLSKNRVCPFLINLVPTDLKPPLSHFNATLPSREDMLKLVTAINHQCGEKQLVQERLDKSFNRCWTEFESAFTKIISAYKPKEIPPKRSLDDMIQEMLELTRSIHKQVQPASDSPSVRELANILLEAQAARSDSDKFLAKLSKSIMQQKTNSP